MVYCAGKLIENRKICRFTLSFLIKAIDRTFYDLLWVYWRDNPLGMLGEHEKSL